MDSSRLSERHKMVQEQLEKRGIQNPWVLQAMLDIPRHFFVPDSQHMKAYDDGPLPIGQEQTISQPYIVAAMIEAIDPEPSKRVLEVGVGSGYSVTVLRRIVQEVYGIERNPVLLAEAKKRIERLGLGQVNLKEGDGTLGWPEAAPFDAILVTAGSPRVPEALLRQLKEGGVLLIPLGNREEQKLLRIVKNPGGRLQEKELFPVRFVPLIGADGWPQ
ncbi:MAG TPA: protein-L-isoaspartate(D-aspartate) O-methyltransferase [bacterium]|nr:protein-L-isoaspartate(D-aspartate) O-methyltransferase [bacterium]